MFWKYHERRNDSLDYSVNFRDLISHMFKPTPDQRLSMADIVNHPWLQEGQIASAEDIKKEFAKRKADIEKKQQEDHEEKQVRRKEFNKTTQVKIRGPGAN